MSFAWRARIAVELVTSSAPQHEADAGADDDREVIARDSASLGVIQLARRLARTDLPVLLQGETGVGKEVLARAIHRASGRAGGPLVTLNCAALSDANAEVELFGDTRRAGVFEQATHGTLFMDEVAELSAVSQAKVLRALQDRAVQRVGGAAVPVDVRVVSASLRDVFSVVVARRFRQDLYFRLNGATVMIPPLRARPADIAEMVQRFAAERGRAITLGPGVLATLTSYSWPGNVRELRHAVESALATADGSLIEVHHLPRLVRGERAATPAGPTEPLLDQDAGLRDRVDAMERATIVAALEGCRWNQSRAAEKLGISRRALIYKMERHGLKARPEPR